MLHRLLTSLFALALLFQPMPLLAKGTCTELNKEERLYQLDCELKYFPKWKARILRDLLASDVARGADVHVLTGGRIRVTPTPEKYKLGILEPYAVKTAGDVMESFLVVARSRGFIDGARNIFLSAKMLVANGTARFFSHMIYILSF